MSHTFHCHLRKSLRWYHDWHNHPHHHHAHWASFLIAAILVSSYISLEITNLRDESNLINPVNAQTSTVLGISGNRFTINGTPKFLVLVTYFDGLDSPNPAADLDYLKSKGFDGIRIMPNWWDWAAGGSGPTGQASNTLMNVDGSIKASRLATLKSILDAANARGMIVDISFTIETVAGPCQRINNPRPDGSYDTFDTMCMNQFKQAVISVAQSLSSYKNIIFDLQNESDGANRLTKFCTYSIPDADCTDGGVQANLLDLRNRIRSLTTSPISTSNGYNVASANAIATSALLDIANWHIANGEDSAAFASSIAGSGASSRPTYVGEPWHTDWNEGSATTTDFINRAVEAKRAGLSAWTFHLKGPFSLNGRSFQSTLRSSESGFIDQFKAVVDATSWGGTYTGSATCSLNFTPKSITRGQSITASWNSSGGSFNYYCTGGLGSGSVPTNWGMVNISPTTSQTCDLRIGTATVCSNNFSVSSMARSTFKNIRAFIGGIAQSGGTTMAEVLATNNVLTLTKIGTGDGTITDSFGNKCGIGCPGGTGSYPSTTKVTLTAVAAAGSNFIGWGGDCSGYGISPCILDMIVDRNVIATFNTAGSSVVVPSSPIFVGSVGQYVDSRGAPHDVQLWRVTNTDDGSIDYFTLAMPNIVSPPYPTIVFVNTYSVFPAPPSVDGNDIMWNSLSRQSPPYYDVSLPSQFRYWWNCATATGDCTIPVIGPPSLNDLRSTSNERFESSLSDTTADWALVNGYAVVVTYSRFYAARGFSTNITSVENSIEALKGMSVINASKIGITGGSQSGTYSVLSLAMPNRPLSIAASVPLYGGYDARTWFDFYFNSLKSLVSGPMFTWMNDGAKAIANRIARSFGSDPLSPSWNPVSMSSVSSVFNTPVLILHGTDDTLVPVVEGLNFYSALKSRGKIANKWIYQNGSPAYSIPTTHGQFDSSSPVKWRVLQRNFFLRHMPPSVSQVVTAIPGDIDLISALSVFRNTICSNPAEKQNTSDLMIQAANPIIRYLSSDTRIPTGDGPTAVAAAINAVWSAEGINWNASNVIANLSAGLIPSICGEVSPPSTLPICSVSFSPASVDNPGDKTTVTWSSSGDADGRIDYACDGSIGVGMIESSGGLDVNPTTSQTCVLTVLNSTGSNTCRATITVGPTVIPPGGDSYSCPGGTICDGTPVTGTPGQQVCGTNLSTWQCTPGGWQDTGSSCSCRGTLPKSKIGSYSCPGGTSCDGSSVTGYPDQQVCGTNLSTWQCTPGGWQDTGFSCSCGGRLSPSEPVPPASYLCTGGTICDGTPVTGTPGQQVCGTNLTIWECTSGGWQNLGSSCTCGGSAAATGSTVTFDIEPDSVSTSGGTVMMDIGVDTNLSEFRDFCNNPSASTFGWRVYERIDMGIQLRDSGTKELFSDIQSDVIKNSFDIPSGGGTSGIYQRIYYVSIHCPGFGEWQTTKSADRIVTYSSSSSTQPLPIQGGEDVNLFFQIVNPIRGAPKDIFGIILLISDWILNIAGFLVTFLIIYSGARFALSRGIPGEVEKAKSMLKWALMGFAVVLIGKGFIFIVDSVLRGQIPSF